MTGPTNFFSPAIGAIQVALGDNLGDAVFIKCTAAALPSAIAGYAVGCIAMATDTGVTYSNTGSRTSCTFTASSSASVLTLPSAFTDSTTTTGASFQITANSITSGKAINLVLGGLTSGTGVLATASTANFTTSGALFKGDMVAATAGNGIVIVTTGAYTGTGLATLTAGAMTTGVGLQVTSTTGLTSGSLIRATTSTAGALATNGAVSITGTGAYTSSSNVGLLDVLASATTAGTVVHFRSSAAGQTTSQILNVTASGYTTGYTGNVVQITGCSTTGASNVASFIGVNTTAGNVVNIQANAITLGAGTALNVNHTTSVLGAGSSLVRISSTGVDTGTTTGVLLDLSTTSAAGSTQILLTDSSADTGARIGFLSSVTNAAAVLAIPLKTSNVAVVNSKFTKHIVMTDGTYVGTIWLDQDATDPNGVVTGVAGDLMLNGPSHKPYYCTTSGTVWATVV